MLPVNIVCCNFIIAFIRPMKWGTRLNRLKLVHRTTFILEGTPRNLRCLVMGVRVPFFEGRFARWCIGRLRRAVSAVRLASSLCSSK